MTDWRFVCLKCGKETTYDEIVKNGGCENCGCHDFQLKLDPVIFAS